jgi:hypothetical protein
VREPRHETAARRRVLDEVNLAVVVLIDVRPIDTRRMAPMSPRNPSPFG